MVAKRENESRRNFLSRILAAWASLVSIPIFYAVAKFVYPPSGKEKIVESIVAGKLDQIPINSAKIVKFNKKPVILVRTPQNQFKAFSANCTHLGCIVEYRAQEAQFICNCHGSIFDLSGKNIKGPAPTPLEAIKVSVKESDIVLSLPLS